MGGNWQKGMQRGKFQAGKLEERSGMESDATKSSPPPATGLLGCGGESRSDNLDELVLQRGEGRVVVDFSEGSDALLMLLVLLMLLSSSLEQQKRVSSSAKR